MEFGTAGELTGLFLSALLSATILPGTSEAALALVLAKGSAGTASAVAVATVGNTVGSVFNWAIGRFFASYRDHPRFPIDREKFERYSQIYRRWGIWTLIMSWVPFIGDPLTIIAGVMRAPLLLVILLVALAKLARYLVVAGIVGLF
jgi:membrane protein YqaA with SNARE-associated domain